MLKRVGVGLAIVLTLALVLANTVLADDPGPPFNGTCPYGEACGGYGWGGHMMGGYGMGGYGYHGTMPDILADALGMTVEDLYAALADGQTIPELAAIQGVSLDELVAAVIAPRVEQLGQAVADGDITQEQADQMIEEMTEHMALRLESFGLGSGGYGGGGCGMMGGGGGSFGHRGGMRGWRGASPGWSPSSNGL